MRLLLGTESGKVSLRDIEFDLQVVQVGKRHDRTLRATSGSTGKLRGDQLALFGGALENRSGHRRADDGRVELRFRIVQSALVPASGRPVRARFLPRVARSSKAEMSAQANSRAAGRLRISR